MTAKNRIDARFGLPPLWAALAASGWQERKEIESEFNRLQQRLARPYLNQAEEAAELQFRKAVAHETAALAWSTAYPILVFPELLTEKAAQARAQWEKQRRLLQGPALQLAETP